MSIVVGATVYGATIFSRFVFCEGFFKFPFQYPEIFVGNPIKPIYFGLTLTINDRYINLDRVYSILCTALKFGQ